MALTVELANGNKLEEFWDAWFLKALIALSRLLKNMNIKGDSAGISERIIAVEKSVYRLRE